MQGRTNYKEHIEILNALTQEELDKLLKILENFKLKKTKNN